MSNNITPRGTYRDENGTLCIILCPKCHMENWAMAVATGQCCWCGYKEKEDEKNT